MPKPQTIDDTLVFAIIGRMYVEREVLLARIAELEKAAQEPHDSPPAEA